MVLTVYLKLPKQFIVQIQQGFCRRDESYFVCTHSASAGDLHRNQVYLPGTGDTVIQQAVPLE